MNAKIFFGLVAFAALAGYHAAGLDIRYLVYVLILLASVGLGALVDATNGDDE